MVVVAPIKSSYPTASNEKQSVSDLSTVLNLTKGDIPPPLVGASTIALNQQIYVFGGRVSSSRQLTNHLYILDLLTLTWSRHIPPPDSGAPPVPRCFHSATTYDDHYIIIFGGIGSPNQKQEEINTMNDICLFDTRTMVWEHLDIKPSLFTPQARYAHLATIWDSSKLVVIGGQDLANQHIHDIHVFDLKEQMWTHADTIQGTHDAYRTIAFHSQESVYIYSNYNFSDINRNLISLNPTNTRKMKSYAKDMVGTRLPPGLRFPTGHILGHYLIVSGTCLSTNLKNFQTWVLNLLTLTWTPIDTGCDILSGSWNRGVVSGKKFYILGHTQRDLKDDYNSRRTNFHHIAIVELEAFGVCVPPPSQSSLLARDLGIFLLNTPRLGDVVIWTSDQRSILVNSAIMCKRWGGFNKFLLEKEESPDHAIQKKQILFPENYAVTLAFLQYIYIDHITTSQPWVLCRLLLFADMLGISRLKELSTYALHQVLSISTARLIYETAILTLQIPLQIRALKMMIHAKCLIMKQIHKEKSPQNTLEESLSPSSSSSYLSDQESTSPTLSDYSSFSSLRRLAQSSSQKSSGSMKSTPFNTVALKKIPLL